MEKDSLFKKIDRISTFIHDYRPLSADDRKELDTYFKIDLTYSSNTLDGNALTLSETKVLLEDGITLSGKSIRDCYEATGHARAYDFMLKLARSTDFAFTEESLKRIHYLFYSGVDPPKAGQYRKESIYITGTEYIPPTAEEVPHLMAALINDLNTKKDVMHLPPMFIVDGWTFSRFRAGMVILHGS